MPIQHVLIVDDALDFGRMLQAALSMMNAGRTKVSLVPSAEEALLEISRRAPELVVSDVRLPGISGLDLIRKVRSRSPLTKIVVVSGMKDPGLAEQARKAGADLFFVKPVAVGDFIESVQRLLQNEPASQLPGEAQVVSAAAVADCATPTLMAELLSTARSSLAAVAAILFAPDGTVLAGVGETPDPALVSRLLPSAQAVLAAAAGLAHPPDPARQEMVLAVKGREADWVLAPTGENMLVLALPAGGGAVRLPLAVESALTLRADLVAVLASTPASVPASNVALSPEVSPVSAPIDPPPTVPSQVENVEPSGLPQNLPTVPPEEEDAETLAGLEDLLVNSSSTLAGGSAGDFWERAAWGGEAPTIDGALTYDQALRLGLAPDHNQR